MTQDKGKAVNGIHLAEQLVIFFSPLLNESCTLRASALENSRRLIKRYGTHNREVRAILTGYKERTMPPQTSLVREVKRSDSQLR